MVSYFACKTSPHLLLLLLLLLQVLFSHLFLISDHSVLSLSLSLTHTHTLFLWPFGFLGNCLINEGLNIFILHYSFFLLIIICCQFVISSCLFLDKLSAVKLIKTLLEQLKRQRSAKILLLRRRESWRKRRSGFRKLLTLSQTFLTTEIKNCKLHYFH